MRTSPDYYNNFFLALQPYCVFFTLKLLHPRLKQFMEILIRDVSRLTTKGVDAQFDVPLPLVAAQCIGAPSSIN